MKIRSRFCSADYDAGFRLARREFFSYAPGTTCQRKCCWMKILSLKMSERDGRDWVVGGVEIAF